MSQVQIIDVDSSLVAGLSGAGVDGDELVLLPCFVAESKVVFSTNTTTVEKLLREQGIAVRRAVVDGEVALRDERGFTWLGPVIFVGFAVLVESPHLLSVSLSVIANYLTDIFRVRESPGRAKLDVVVEFSPNRAMKKISYDGPVEGIGEISKSLEEMVRAQKTTQRAGDDGDV